jgi:dTMP kinase
MHGRELDRFERESDDFHERVRNGFARMAADDPDHWVVIDASAGIDEVYASIRAAVHDRLGI